MNVDPNGVPPVVAPDPSEEVSPQQPATTHEVALPRRRFGMRLLGAVPLAIVALAAAQPETAHAGTDGDWTLTGNAIPDATKFLGTTNAQPLILKTSNSTRLTVTSGGNVGIGTTSPANKFHVVALNTAVRAESTITSGTSYGVVGKSAAYTGRGVYGEASSTSTGVSYGVHGKNASSSGAGVYGEATATSGIANGVEGRSYSISGDGVRGLALANTGSTYGVVGSANSNTGVGVRGESGWAGVEGEGSSNGVRGVATGEGGNGVVGIATGDGVTFSVWGINDSPSPSAYAGYFNGNVYVYGTLSKAAGSFKIDHPLDPANLYLSHSFVESPDMLNVYNGNVTMGADGKAVVQLPAYFEALNRDFRYQLTAIGAPAPNLHVANKIANRRFTIAGGEAGMEVSWQVTGVRDDAYARAHPIVVEQPKPEHERGTYLTPKEHGQPETAQVHYDKLQTLKDRERELAKVPSKLRE